jgi:hypothetical protein
MDFYYTALPQAAMVATCIHVFSAQRSEHEFNRTARPAKGPGVLSGHWKKMTCN